MNPSDTHNVDVTKTYRTLRDLKRPRGLPLIGNVFQVSAPLLHLKLEEWGREFGDIYTVKLGLTKLLIVTNASDIAQILRDRPEGFDRTKKLTDIFTEMGFKIGLFGANGELWKKQRRMAMSAFDPAHVKDYFPSMCKVAQRLGQRWHQSLGSEIDLQADLMRYTVDTITGLAFGQNVNSLEAGDDIIQAHLDKIFPAIHRRNLAIFPYWRFIRFKSDRELTKSVNEVNTAIHHFVKKTRDKIAANPHLKETPSNVLEAMINAADEGNSGLTDDDVAGNVITLLLAGEDTTANSLAWMLHLLWENPEALTKLQQEIDSVMGQTQDNKQANITHFEPQELLQKLNQLDYVDACISESMRLKPVAPLILLHANKDCIVGDVEVPKKTLLLLLMRQSSLSEKNVTNASKFTPERWLIKDAPSEDANKFSRNSVKRISMPFGAGARICPARYLALLEIKVAVVMLLTQFKIVDINTKDKKPTKELLAFTMAPTGLTMRLAAR